MTTFLVLLVFALIFVYFGENDTPHEWTREAWRAWQEKYPDWRKW